MFKLDNNGSTVKTLVLGHAHDLNVSKNSVV